MDNEFRDSLKNLSNYNNEPDKKNTMEVDKNLVFESEYVLNNYISVMESYIDNLSRENDENLIALMRGKLNDLKAIHAQMKAATEKQTAKESAENKAKSKLDDPFK